MLSRGNGEAFLDKLGLTYTIIYSFWYFYDKVFFPQTIHIYAYKLVKNKLIEDRWNDWLWAGIGPYSPRLGYEILLLKQAGLLRETCVSDNSLCGLLTLPETAPKPERLYLVAI